LNKGGAFCKRLDVCTLAFYFQVSEDWPLLVAANRDEHYDRPAAPPQLLDTQPEVLAGLDLRAGGTWLGVNENGVLAAVLNRRSSATENSAGRTRSRGLLCLDLLMQRTALAGVEFVAEHREHYQPFTLVFGDSSNAFFAFNANGDIQVVKLEPGLHVFNNAGMHDEYSEKRQRAYALFSAVKPEEKSFSRSISSCLANFRSVLSDHTLGSSPGDPREAICVHSEISGTVSSSVIFFSAPARQFRTFYSGGPPCQNNFQEMSMMDVL
jgi:uncharacterized protein with NRDE domain